MPHLVRISSEIAIVAGGAGADEGFVWGDGATGAGGAEAAVTGGGLSPPHAHASIAAHARRESDPRPRWVIMGSPEQVANHMQGQRFRYPGGREHARRACRFDPLGSKWRAVEDSLPCGGRGG